MVNERRSVRFHSLLCPICFVRSKIHELLENITLRVKNCFTKKKYFSIQKCTLPRGYHGITHK